MATEKIRKGESGIKFGHETQANGSDNEQDDVPDVTPLAPAHSQKNGIWDPKPGSSTNKITQHGFSIPDLINLGALADGKEENIQPNNLKGPIHPAFAFEKWEKSAPSHFKRKHLYHIRPDLNGSPRSGLYSAENPIVWNVLEPCLRLASKFLKNAHLFPWYDALLHGEITPISNTIFEGKERASPLQSIFLRSESDFKDPECAKATRKYIATIAKRIRLGISSGQVDPTGAESCHTQYDGMTIPPWEDDGETYRIYLAFQSIEPLLLDGLTPSTRLALEFHIAVTLLHEFAHVLAFAKSPSQPSSLYFEDERMIEAGKGFEMHTFGGHPVLVQINKKTHCQGGLRAGFLLEDWLGKPKGTQSLAPISGTDRDWINREWRECRSIPLSFLEELGQEDFWNCFVGKWGADALKVFPWTDGRLVRQRGDILDTRILAPPEKYPPWLEEALKPSLKNSRRKAANEVLAAQFAVKRISQSRVIADAVTRDEQPSSPEAIVRQDDSIRVMSGEEEHSPSQNRAKSTEERPTDAKYWNIIKYQRNALLTWSKMCMEAEAHVQRFLSRMGGGTPDHGETENDLMKINAENCKQMREWIEMAFDEELVASFEQLLKRFEKLKSLLGRVSRQTSEDRELAQEREVARDECATLLEQAEAYQRRGESQKCGEICDEILSRKHVSQYDKGEANLLLGLCTTQNTKLKVWHATEAVRIFKLDQYKKRRSIEPTLIMKEKLTYAEECLKFAKAEQEAAGLEKPPEQISSKFIDFVNPVTPSTLSKAPKPLTSPTPTNPERATPTSPSTPLSHLSMTAHLDPAPFGLTATEIHAHRRTFRSINRARRAFLAGDFAGCERRCLELLRDPTDVSIWQQARANVFLARIPWRDDKVERVEWALEIYEVVEGWYAGVGGEKEERARRARAQAKRFKELVVGSVGEGGEGEREGTVESLKRVVDGEDPGDKETGVDMGLEVEEEREWKRSQSLVSGVVPKGNGILGTKRRRGGHNDSEDDRSGRGKRFA